jgi:PAS domain S-box-containing protein
VRAQTRRPDASLPVLFLTVVLLGLPASAQTVSKLIYGGDSGFPPYEYLDADGHPQGFNVQLVQAVAREAGIALEIRLAPWQETMAAFDAGKVDFISLGYSDARALKYDLLPPAWTLHQDAIFLNGRAAYPESIEQLGVEIVCVEQGSLMQELLKELPEFRRPVLRPVRSQLDCLPRLAKKEVTAAAGNGLALRLAARQIGLTTLTAVTLKTVSYHYATRKGRGAALEPLAAALGRLQESGRFARLVEENLTAAPPRSWRDFAGMLELIGVLFLLVVAASVLWNRSLRWQVQARTREVARSQQAYASLINSVDGIVWEFDPRAQVRFVSAQAERMLGHPLDDWLKPGFTHRLILPEDAERVFPECERHAAAGREHQSEFRVRAADGRVLWMRNFTSVAMENGKPAVLRGVMVDITESKRLEEQLRQAQKMEAVGRLAGGVAHDFNNLLTVIKGYSTLLLQDQNATPPLRLQMNALREIDRAAGRAGALTRQLLAFSRRQVLRPEVLDLNQVIAGLTPLVRRLIGEDVTVVVTPTPDLGKVRADLGQIEQVLMNLLVNARDAMPSGGTVQVCTANLEIDEADAGQKIGVANTSAALDTNVGREPLPAGSYVVMSVTDSGTGMDAETRAHLFEPFFTTKPEGKGTGLGLATVYGIVKQSGGAIAVRSEPGQGATFRILLPRLAASEAQQSTARRWESESSGEMLVPGTERQTILLVEDEEALCKLARAFLTSQGYHVIAALTAEEAIRRAAKHIGPIPLLVTDIVMTGMNGTALADTLKKLRPEMAVLYISGYTDHAVSQQAIADGADFLAKPFGREDLVGKVRAILDRNVARSDGDSATQTA